MTHKFLSLCYDKYRDELESVAPKVCAIALNCKEYENSRTKLGRVPWEALLQVKAPKVVQNQ